MTGKPKFLHDNRLDDATPTASSTDPDTQFDVKNLRDWRPYTFWKPASLPATVRIVSAPGNRGADYLLMFGHDVFSKHCNVALWRHEQADFAGSATAVASSNFVDNPDDFDAATWMKEGVAAVEANAIVAPDGTRTADKLTGLGENGIDRIRWGPSTAFLPALNPVEPSIWIKRISTAGVLNMSHFWDAADGQWLIDLALLSNDWERITRDHVAVTVTNEWRADALQRLGFALYNNDPLGPLLSIYAWRANLQACAATDRRTTPFSNGLVDVPILVPFVSVDKPAYEVHLKALSGTEIPAIGVVAFGEALAMPRGLPYPFDPIGRRVRGQVNRSVAGHPLGKVIEFEEVERRLTFRNLTWGFVRDTFLPAWTAHLRGEPFGFAWDPDDHPEEVYLVAAGDELSFPHKSGDFTDLEIAVTGVA